MNKKKFMYFALTAIVLTIILLVVLFITSNDDKNKRLFFDDYLYYNDDKISEKGFEDLATDNVSSIYYADAVFLGRNGTAYFYRENFDKTFVKNSFKINLENVNDVTKLDNEIQGFIGAFQGHINYNGNTSHSLSSPVGKEIDYEKNVVASVIEDGAMLTFSIIDKEKSYTINILKEESNITLELSYNGELDSFPLEEMPEGTNGVG